MGIFPAGDAQILGKELGLVHIFVVVFLLVGQDRVACAAPCQTQQDAGKPSCQYEFLTCTFHANPNLLCQSQEQ